MTVAAAVLAVFGELGVDAVFLNPGTDTAPFQEAVAAAADPPRLVLCLHEAVALAAAHGYFAATGRPQVVMVHVDVGTQNLGSMVHNAARAEVGVVIVAGRTPVTSYGELPGGRDTPVHWMQDVPDQAGVVRPYVKWSSDLEPAVAIRTVTRAFQVARSGRPGPVYLTAAREALMAPAAKEDVDPARFPAATPAAPDPVALRRLADLLVRARSPVVVTARIGRDPAAVADLVAVAEATGARVMDGRERVNFPSDHPAYLRESADAAAALRAADAVLVLDCPVPWVPLASRPPDDATVVSMEHDPVHPSMPGWSYPVDLAIACDPAVGVRELAAALRDLQPTVLPAPAEPQQGDELTTAADVAEVCSDLLGDDDIVVEEATTNVELLRTGLRRTRPGTYFRSGGSGLGWALGASLGIALAHPDRRVVTIVGDGAFVFGEPLAALWAMRRQGVATVVIVLRNGGYAASSAPLHQLYPDGAAVAAVSVPGTTFDTGLDLAEVATVCGGQAYRPTTRAQLRDCLDAALAGLAEHTSSVIEVPVRSPWLGEE